MEFRCGGVSTERSIPGGARLWRAGAGVTPARTSTHVRDFERFHADECRSKFVSAGRRNQHARGVCSPEAARSLQAQVPEREQAVEGVFGVEMGVGPVAVEAAFGAPEGVD